MSASAVVLTADAMTTIAAAVIWRLMVRASRRRNTERARRMIATRQAALKAAGSGGTHEACEVPEREELIFDRYASRYDGLGQDVTRNREDQP